MIRDFEYWIVFTSAPGVVLPEENYRYRIQSWKVNEIKAYKKCCYHHNFCNNSFGVILKSL